VFGLALILPPLMDRLRPWISPDPMLPRALWSWWRRAAMTVACWLVNGIAVSLTAWLVSAPLIATYFHLFTPASLIANVPVVACGMLALVSCFGSLLCGSWLAPITELFNHAAWFFMKCMMMISRWVATLPGAFHYVRGPDAYFFVAYYTGLFGLGTDWLLRPKVRRWALGGFAVVMIVGVTQWQTDRKTVRLNLLPGTPAVFQEDFARRSNLLVDTGDARGIESGVIPILQTRGVDGLNAIALTHASKHQVAGLTNLIKIMPPQIVHRSHAKIRSTRYSRAIDELLAARPNLERRVSVGDHIGAWEVLHPGRGEDQSRNIDNALVLRAKFHGVRVLLMSDLGEIGQELLVRRVDDLRADLLITSVPNFGEPLQPWLLEAIKPRVILVHDSYFPLGERAPAKLRARLARIEAQVYYTTDVGGTRVEIAPGDWRVLNASGILWSSR
jgi:beta-lactamase superfamily II metal-dependent hydrolase